MSSAAQTLVLVAIVPGMIAYVVHEFRAAITDLRAPALAAQGVAAQGVDVCLIEAAAIAPRTSNADPNTPDQWRIAA